MSNQMSKPDLERIFDRISTRLNDVLCEMKPDYDDSIVGFNEAWDIMRAIFKDELAKAPPPPSAERDLDAERSPEAKEWRRRRRIGMPQ